MTATIPKPSIKTKPQQPNQSTPIATASKLEHYIWGPYYPICKNAEEDWDGKHQKQLQQTNKNVQIQDTQPKNSYQAPNTKQAQNPQHAQEYQMPRNPQPTQTQFFSVPDKYADQIQQRRKWEKESSMKNMDLITSLTQN